MFPYKDRILDQAEEARRQKKEEQEERRQEARERRKAEKGSAGDQDEDDMEMDDDDEEASEMLDDDDEEMGDDTDPMAALMQSAQARAKEFENTQHESDEDSDDGIVEYEAETVKDNSRRAFDKTFKALVSASDVVLYVLDARDPLGTRSRETEQSILADPSKRLILVLNKIDLVPGDVLKQWLQHLRRIFPTIPFIANVSSSAPFDHKKLTPTFTANNVIRALKTFSAASQLKRAITVGIVGYPNVGKSSIINALTSRLSGSQSTGKRKKVDCPVGAEAGVTTALREIKLDGNLKLLDSPGIVFPSTEEASRQNKTEEQARLVLLNAIPPKDIQDPIPAVELLVKRLGDSTQLGLLDKLTELYAVPALMHNAVSTTDQTSNFLVHVARKRGRLGKGGVPNLHSAAMAVLSDWRDGRIQGWAEPPSSESAASGLGAGASSDEKRVVDSWSKEFKIEGLWGDES